MGNNLGKWHHVMIGPFFVFPSSLVKPPGAKITAYILPEDILLKGETGSSGMSVQGWLLSLVQRPEGGTNGQQSPDRPSVQRRWMKASEILFGHTHLWLDQCRGTSSSLKMVSCHSNLVRGNGGLDHESTGTQS